MAITTAAPRDSIGSALWNELAGLINGSSGAGEPTSLTDIGSTAWIAANAGISANSLWSLSLRNQGTLGQALRILNTSGTQTVGVTTAAMTLALPVALHDPGGTHLVIKDSTNTTTLFSVTDASVGGSVIFSGLGIVLPESYGAVADFQRINGCAITSGTTSLAVVGVNPSTNQPANFTAADVGKLIEIDGAGPAAANLITTVATVVDATHVTIATPAGTSVSGPACTFGTDNTTAFNNMFVALRGPNIHGPTKVLLVGNYMVGNLNVTSLNGVAIGGPAAAPGAGPAAANLCPKPGITGNWIDFSGCAYVRLENLNIGRSDQYQWVPSLAVGLLCASYSGQEATGYEFDNCYIDGYYSTATVYFDKMNQVEADTCYFYNYHASARALVITAYNADSITSAFGTVNTVHTWGPSWLFHFKSCQFIDAGYILIGSPYTTPSGGFCLAIDGSYALTFDTCQFVGNTTGVLLQNGDTSGAHLSRTIAFRECVWENPNSGGVGAAEMRTAFELGSNTTYQDFILDACRFQVSTAWVKDNASAGATTALDRWAIRAPHSVLGTESSIIINNSGTATRLTNCDLDLHDLTITVGGSIDHTVRLLTNGTITTTGGSNLAWVWTNSAPTFYGSLIAASTILDSAGNILLTPNTRAFVPSTPSGTPVANGLFQQSLTKFSVLWNTSGTIQESYNVTSVTDTGTGDQNVTIDRDFAAATWTPSAMAISDTDLHARVTANLFAAGTCRVICSDNAGTPTDPSYFAAFGHGAQ